MMPELNDYANEEQLGNTDKHLSIFLLLQ